MDNMEQVMVFASAMMVFVTAAVQLVKTTVNVPKNLVPLIGLILGLIIGAVADQFTDLDLTLRLWSGGIAGLSATGLFELVFNKREGTTK